MVTETLATWTSETKVPFIYGLVDPVDTKHVRYVGMAMRAKRPYMHADNTRKKRDTKNPYLTNWIRKVQAEGREPSVLVLEELPEGATRNFTGLVERMYIASLRSIGHRLTNISDGGWGGDQGPEINAKISASQKGKRNRGCGKPHTPEHRAWMKAKQEKLYEDGANREIQRLAQEKAWADPDKRGAHSIVMRAQWAKKTAEQRQEIAKKRLATQVLNGTPVSAEARANMSKAQTGRKHSPKTLAKIAASVAAYYARRKAAK